MDTRDRPLPFLFESLLYLKHLVGSISKMMRSFRPLVSKFASTSSSSHASTSVRILTSTPSRSLATPAVEGRTSPVRATSVEESVLTFHND